GLQSEDRELGIFKGYRFKGLTEFEYNSTNFNFIDRFRYIEFDRDWGLSSETLENPAAERFFLAQLGLEKDPLNRFDYKLYLRNRAHVLSGSQHTANWNTEIGRRFRLRQEFFRLQSDQDTLTSDWTRYLGNVNYQSKILVPGYQFSIDRNALRNTETDSIVSTAMNFQEHLVFLKSND